MQVLTVRRGCKGSAPSSYSCHEYFNVAPHFVNWMYERG